jgi:hypothetical protein
VGVDVMVGIGVRVGVCVGSDNSDGVVFVSVKEGGIIVAEKPVGDGVPSVMIISVEEDVDSENCVSSNDRKPQADTKRTNRRVLKKFA